MLELGILGEKTKQKKWSMQVAGIPTEEIYQIGHKLWKMIHHEKTLSNSVAVRVRAIEKRPSSTQLYLCVCVCSYTRNRWKEKHFHPWSVPSFQSSALSWDSRVNEWIHWMLCTVCLSIWWKRKRGIYCVLHTWDLKRGSKCIPGDASIILASVNKNAWWCNHSLASRLGKKRNLGILFVLIDLLFCDVM